jgi:hypothetical protein
MDLTLGYQVLPARQFDPDVSHSIVRPDNKAAFLRLMRTADGHLELRNVLRNDRFEARVEPVVSRPGYYRIVSGPLLNPLFAALIAFISARRSYEVGKYPLEIMFKGKPQPL